MTEKYQINITINRDAAHYLFMLLGDQLLDIGDKTVNQHVESIRDAYLHVKTIIERSLERNLTDY